MSDYLQACTYLHSGKDWAFNATNHLSDIRIETPPSNEEGFIHMVYRLPRCIMQSNAATFADWQTVDEGTKESQAYRVTFTWFIDFVYRLGLRKKQPKKPRGSEEEQEPTIPDGNGVILFFEVVKSTTDSIVGERIHVFINRGNPDVAGVFSFMLSNAVRRSEAKKPFYKEWEYYMRHVKTKEEYVLNVCDVYKNNTLTSEQIYSTGKLLANDEIRSFEASPFQIFSLDNFEIEGACPRQNNRNNYFRSGKFVFPNEKLVVKRFWHQLQPTYLWKKYLPSHQYNWVDLPEIIVSQNPHDMLNKDIYIKPCPARCLVEDFLTERNIQRVNDTWTNINDDVYDKIVAIANGRFTIYSKREDPQPMEIYDWISANMVYDSTFVPGHGSESMEYTDRLKSKFQNQHSISAFDIIEMETSYRMSFSDDTRLVKHTMIQKFEQMCVTGDADISAPGKAIARWLLHLRPELHEQHGFFSFEIRDRALSPFGNMQFWFQQSLDSFMCVASAHPELVKLHYAKYDAYRQHGINQLHWNSIYTGESATSKSFAFERAADMSVPGTISEITYQTTRADAIDGDQNDHITIFNEAPPGLFQASSKSEDAQKALSSMKEKLTSNRVRTKEFVRDEETGERKNRIAISSQIGVYMGATNDNPALAEEAVKSRFHWGEFDKVYRVDKTIADYKAKDIEMQNKPELKKKYEQFIFYCQDQQMKVFFVWKFIFCGIVRDVDLDAANIVLSGISKNFKKFDVRIPPRTTERFYILCRILTITNALDILYHFIGSKYHMQEFKLEQLLDVEPLLYCTEEIAICAMNMVTVEIPQLTVSREKTIRAMWKVFKLCPSYKKDKTHTGAETVDFNYIRFKNGIHQLCVKIQNAIPFSTGKPSIHNIHGVLQQLMGEPFRAYTYKSKEQEPYSTRYEDDHSRAQVANGKKPVVVFIPGTGFNDFHIGLFEELRTKTDKNIMNECIRQLSHTHTKERKIVLGLPQREKGVIRWPQFMETLQVKRDVMKEGPAIKNSSQETSGVKRMLGLNDGMLGEHDVTLMDTDTDSWGWCRRCMEFLEIKQDDAIEFHPEIIHETLGKSQQEEDYPRDLMTTQQSQATKKKIKASERMNLNIHELVQARKRRRTVGIAMAIE
tara:strand:+ start:1219 stop:4605 length:3387 start_codon:yes stop_codon:yes gene_type:complete